jgi:flagellin-specific chaperone FliS
MSMNVSSYGRDRETFYKNMSELGHYQNIKFSQMKAIDLTNPANVPKKDLSIHINNASTDFLRDKFQNIEEFKNKEPEEQIKGKDGRPLEYYYFDNIVQNIGGISEDQRTEIKNAIIASTESAKVSSTTSDVYAMGICQTNMELKAISKNLIPEGYQDWFNRAADQYTKGLSDDFTSVLRNLEIGFSNITEPELVNKGIREKSLQAIKDLDSGNDIFQTTEKIYSDLFKNVDVSKPDTIKNSLDSVYNDLVQNGTKYTKGRENKEEILKQINYLKEKWNTVASTTNAFSSQKFVTSLDYRI